MTTDYPTIPPMTHPLGKAWPQPAIDKIKFALDCAWVSKDDFDKLLDYSNSMPSAVYEGKMWKKKTYEGWILMWFGPCNDPNKCSINSYPLMIEK